MRVFSVLLVVLLLCGCSAPPTDSPITVPTLYTDNETTEQFATTEVYVAETTSEPSEETTVPPTDPTPQDKTDGTMVWIPTKGGTKYHSRSTCSNMKNPSQVTKDEAIGSGFTPCKKCYK